MNTKLVKKFDELSNKYLIYFQLFLLKIEYICKNMKFDKIIFLDIDGVLRTFKSDLEWSKLLNKPVFKDFERRFDPKAASIINEIAFYTNSKIVISSNWRIKLTLDKLRQIFRENGIYVDIVDKLDILASRGEEIRYWLDNNQTNNYIIIDDDVSDIEMYILKDRIIKVDSKIGLTEDYYIEEIIDRLI